MSAEWIDASWIVGLTPSVITAAAESVIGNGSSSAGPAGSIALATNTLLGRTSGHVAAIPTVTNSIMGRQSGDLGALSVASNTVVCNAGSGLVALPMSAGTVLGMTSGGLMGAQVATAAATNGAVCVRSASGQIALAAASADADATIRSQQNQRRNGVVSSARLLLSNQPANNDTIGIGADTYTFKNSPVAPTDVQIGGSANATCNNLVTKINSVGTVAIVADNLSGNCRIRTAASVGGTVIPGATNAVLAESITDAADVWDIGNVNLNTTAGENYAYIGYASAQLTVTAAMVAGPCIVASFEFNVRHFIAQVRSSAGECLYVTDLFTVVGGSSILWTSGGATNMASTNILTILASA